MTIRKIIFLPDERLRQPNLPVSSFDAKLHSLIDDMFETMYNARGVGLAAPQIAINIRLAVLDVVGDRKHQIVIANPEIIAATGEFKYQEGCLSVPSAYETVIRAEKVKVRAQDKNGEFFEITGDGLLGECLQHEIDHLNGKLFIDMLSPIKRAMARKKVDKYKRIMARERPQ